jgi:hypothetical protein
MVMAKTKELSIGEKLTVYTVPGREGKAISRHQDGRVILFDQNSQYSKLITPYQSVECQVVIMQEKFIIVSPIKAPVKAEAPPVPEVKKEDEGEDLDDILEEFEKIDSDRVLDDLEKLMARANKNSKAIPRALINIIGLQRLTLRILTGRTTEKR